jgi:hypothetical protein
LLKLPRRRHDALGLAQPFAIHVVANGFAAGGGWNSSAVFSVTSGSWIALQGMQTVDMSMSMIEKAMRLLCAEVFDRFDRRSSGRKVQQRVARQSRRKR